MTEFEFALILQLSHDALYERRLTLAVSAHKGYLVATLYCEVNTAEHRLVVERHSHIAHLYRIGTAARTWRELKA